MNSETLQLSSMVKAALPDAAQSLERAWQRRRQELAGWQPSGGWLLSHQQRQIAHGVAARAHP